MQEDVNNLMNSESRSPPVEPRFVTAVLFRRGLLPVALLLALLCGSWFLFRHLASNIEKGESTVNAELTTQSNDDVPRTFADLTKDEKEGIRTIISKATEAAVENAAAKLEKVFSDKREYSLWLAVDRFGRKSAAQSPESSVTIIIAFFPEGDLLAPCKHEIGENHKLRYFRIIADVPHPIATLSIVEVEEGSIYSIETCMQYSAERWESLLDGNQAGGKR